jgi:hypothetical protein
VFGDFESEIVKRCFGSGFFGFFDLFNLFRFFHYYRTRFSQQQQTALHHKMPLQGPKKQAGGGYLLALDPPISSPSLKWSESWTPTDEWAAWAEEHRKQLLGELLSHGNWFSRPPRRDLIETIFAPWIGKNMKGELQFFGALPTVPVPGTASLTLQGLTMSAAAIAPVWTVENFTPDPEEDRISLFGEEDGEDEGPETREIEFAEIEISSPVTKGAPMQIRNREWEAKKFLAKERVREARLKAQVAEHIARKEESRFLTTYGELDDNESNFSEYDLSENGSVEESDSENSQMP